jgi:uncharacterized protein
MTFERSTERPQAIRTLLRTLRSRRSLANLAGAVIVAVTGYSVLAEPRAAQAPAPPSARPAAPSEADARPLRVLFLGHDQAGSHASPAVYQLLAAPLARRGIQLTHAATPAEALVPERLAHYDALMIYGDHETLTPDQERALVDFVEGGKGVVALHSAAAMFGSSARYVSLIGARMERQGEGEFTAEIVAPGHPIMQGLQPFRTWDGTFVSSQHNPENRTVLMERVDGDRREPWTWVRTHGKGRVFYTAYGHDQRTWSNPAFHKLIEQGTLWAVPEPARLAWIEHSMPEVTYVDTFIVPNYENREPAPKYQLPFTAADSMKFIKVPAEFKLELFVEEPDINQPITFNFDEQGRLWVIEAIDYPNRVLDGAPGDDRIKIFEDTTGDGRADKITVFAEDLNLATSLVFANGGVIVAAAPHMLFLKDTTGDGKADVRQILSTGWGIRDSHAGPSNLMYGPDNYIWGTIGYSGFDGEMNGRPMQFGQGMFRFRPDGSDFEYVTGSTNNTWGIGMTETFDVFGSTANNDPSFYVAIPNRYFEGVQGLPMPPGGGRGVGAGYQSAAQFYAVHPITPYIRQVDVHGGYTAAAGHHIYTARAFPRWYWNRVAFITEPTAHLIGQGVLEKQGAGYVTRDGWNLLAGAEEWVAPVHAQVGPDGAVWVSDWYNFIAQHNPTPPGFSNGIGNAYETSMRDRHRGRIYRVVWRDAPPARPMSLSVDDVKGLLAALGSDNMLWRLHAQRLLIERGQKDVVSELVALIRNPSLDELGLNGAALHALWTLHGLGEMTAVTSEGGRAAVEALKHPAAGVRKAAAMVLPRTADAARAIVDAGLVQDPDLHTRLAVLLALADMPASASLGGVLYKASFDTDNYTDRWLSRALYIAATRHRDAFLTEYRGDPKAVAPDALPVSLRIGATKPDWRRPDAATLASDWKDMEVPGNWEARGLPDFDGVVWFTRTVDVAQPGAEDVLSLGRIANTAEVWVNGLSVTPLPPPAAPAGAGPAGRGAGGGRGGPPPYGLPPGTLRAGENTITVRITNTRNEGGFLGAPDTMYLQTGATRIPLAGTWRYRVERQTNAGALYSRPGELAAHVAFAAAPVAAGAALPEPVVAEAPDVIIPLSVTVGEMQFDKTEITVAPGQLVEIVFSNPDSMQHNFLLGAPGTLQQIGLAADDLARSPAGVTQQYVPEIPQVLFASTLLDPGDTLTFQFRAPAQPGDYPYVCTFPGHWRIMNGTLHVVAPAGRGGRGGRGGG